MPAAIASAHNCQPLKATMGAIVLPDKHVIDDKRFVAAESSLEAVKPSAAAIC
jgi:hypothetical protein